MAEITGDTIIEYGLAIGFTELEEAINTFQNGGRDFLLVENKSVSSITITIEKVISDINIQGYGELTKSANTFTLASESICAIGTFPIAPYNEDDGIVTFEVSSFGDIFVSVLTLG